MSTVYTLNGKVLKNVTTGKWLAKKEAPAGFVMNASNTSSTTNTHATWESPGYPDGWDGGGKTLELTVSQDITTGSGIALMYNNAENANGPIAVEFIRSGTLSAGKYTYTLSYNAAPTSSGYGKYLVITDVKGSTSNWLPYISMVILD